MTRRNPDLIRVIRGSVRHAVAYCAGSCFAFSAHSSQQTVISLPATVTLMPPSLIAQSQTGHLLVFMSLSPLNELTSDGERLPTHGKTDFQNLAYFDLCRISDGAFPNSRRNASVK